jgi:hypothetical protein
MHTPPLLCELHAHTTWSDGVLTLTEIVDLYGMHGFDVLCVTDHVLPTDPLDLTEATHPHYVAAIEREARRAMEQYGLLLIPGLELTFYEDGPDGAGHALALGRRDWVPLDRGLEHALRVASGTGAAIVAAHPHGELPDPSEQRTTRWFWHHHARLGGVVHRYELINRDETFGWIADRGLPGIATGDFHQPDHLETWKTLLPCSKTEEAVLAYLRSAVGAYVVPWHLREAARRLAA